MTNTSEPNPLWVNSPYAEFAVCDSVSMLRALSWWLQHYPKFSVTIERIGGDHWKFRVKEEEHPMVP